MNRGTIVRELIRGVKLLRVGRLPFPPSDAKINLQLLQSDQGAERFGEAEMPRLMDRQDWKTVMSDVGTAENVWYENVVCDARNASYSLPGAGRYRVIFVKLDDGGKIGETDTPRRRKLKISPEVRALRGTVSLEDKRDYKEILADSLQDKYESLT